MSTISELLVKIGLDSSDLESGMEETSGFVDRNFGKITAAGAVAGAGLEGFARSQQGANVAFERMGRVTGEGSQAMRDMAGDLQNVTFPMEDVVDLMETATQRGLEGEGIAEFATFWDMVGDATGEAGPKLGEAGVALGLVGIAAGEEAEALDAFGFITDNTTGSVEGFLKFIEKSATEIEGPIPSINDMAAALGALEEEGLSAERSQRELRTALSESDGDMMAALETLGVSQDEFAAQTEAVEGSSGAIEANAQALADSFTPMQKLSAGAESLMTKYGGLSSAAGALAGPMLALGPISKGVSAGLGGITKMGPAVVGGFSKVGGAFGKLSKLLKANPWILLITATVALVTLIVKNWDTIVAFLKKAWDWIKGAVSAVGEWMSDAFQKAVDFLKDLFFKFTPLGFLIKNFDKIKDAVSGVKDWVVEKFQAAVDWLKGLGGKISSAVSGAFDKVKDLAVEAKDWVSDRVDDVVGFFTDMPGRISRVVGGLFDGVKTAFKSAVNWIIDKWNALEISIGGGSILGVDIPKITVSTPNIPRFHDGGVFQAPSGQSEGLALLEDGERVTSADASPQVVVNMNGVTDPFAVGDAVAWRMRTQGV